MHLNYLMHPTTTVVCVFLGTEGTNTFINIDKIFKPQLILIFKRHGEIK